MIPDHQTNTVYVAGCLKTKHPTFFNKLSNVLKDHDYQLNELSNTKDIWARDYMPIQVSDKKFIEYRYDPDYLQGTTYEVRSIKSYPDIVCANNDIKTIKTDIILDGGNIVKSTDTVILVDKVVKENAHNYTKEKLILKLKELFEVENIILIPWDLECEFGHSDGMLRFIDNKKVLISGLYDYEGDGFKDRLLATLDNHKIKYDWLKCSNYDDSDNCFYINFLQVGNLIIVPGLNKKEKDDKALAKIKTHFAKGFKFEQIAMPEITRKGGALNCITWTIKK